MISMLVGACIGGSVAEAKKKKKPATAGEVKKETERKRPPGDKGANEGAQGRQNATEDAARAAEGQNNSYGNPR